MQGYCETAQILEGNQIWQAACNGGVQFTRHDVWLRCWYLHLLLLIMIYYYASIFIIYFIGFWNDASYDFYSGKSKKTSLEVIVSPDKDNINEVQNNLLDLLLIKNKLERPYPKYHRCSLTEIRHNNKTKRNDLGPLLLTWINFNPSMDKWLHPLYCVGWNYLAIPKLWSLGMDK